MSIISFSSWVRAYQNGGKLTYEAFVKDYVAFWLVVKGQIVIHTTEVDSAEIEDIEENVKEGLWSSSCLALFSVVMWSNGCGKTRWIVELLKSHEELYTHMPKKLIWIYGVEQPRLFKT